MFESRRSLRRKLAGMHTFALRMARERDAADRRAEAWHQRWAWSEAHAETLAEELLKGELAEMGVVAAPEGETKRGWPTWASMPGDETGAAA
jgi:hypothetical protein